ncbi:hypothetical protein EV421DRAFT_1893115 [Armillaria borealis]|uniref:DUF659 domain-containing protein n=1 Tax=Armillaria borealis TaxID=47425 RepID=A0AA39MFX2_9AGAR|nr:hypothetical protein EV421DRAFT_1893115 [Armillaria borealis]
MPALSSPLWKFFYKSSVKQNQHHYKAYCYGCLNTHHPLTVNDEITQKNVLQFHEEDWFISACTTIRHLCGEHSALCTHLLKCNNASVEAKAVAKQDCDLQKKQKCLFENIKKSMKQLKLKVYQGIDILFTEEQKEEIHQQFCHATISANLPYQWVEDPEIIKLLLMFRSHADSVIPSRKVLSRCLLDQEYDWVQDELKDEMKGKYNSVTRVDASTYLIDVQNTTVSKKDGESMCTAFEEMIDHTERVYKCIPVDMVTDGDSGSQHGQDLLSIKCPWIFTSPCSSYQFQLILGDYFKECAIGATAAEQAMNLTGWILGHQPVRSIFDRAQEFKNNEKVWAYLVTNLICWTTHSLSFNCLIILKPSLRYAVAIGEEKIVDTQVGAEKDSKDHCKLIDSAEFWTSLEQVTDNIEPIYYGTNINQSDKTHPDQVVLTFTGIYLHFEHHPDRTIVTGMSKCIEKQWAAMDQLMYIFALILNPYKQTDRFRDKAGANVFTLSTDIITGNNPILVWEQLQGTPEVAELVDFTILLVGVLLQKMSTVSTQQYSLFMKAHMKDRLCQNHATEQVQQLLAIPHYADTIEEGADMSGSEEEGAKRKLFLVVSKAAWRHELARWQKSDSTEAVMPVRQQGHQTWLLAKLSALFGSIASHLIEQELLMELLVAEYSDELVDDGALEGSGDDFKG